MEGSGGKRRSILVIEIARIFRKPGPRGSPRASTVWGIGYRSEPAESGD